MSSKRTSVPVGDTITSRVTAASSRTTRSHPGMNDGGLCGPVAVRSTTFASAMRTFSAEIRPPRISSGS